MPLLGDTYTDARGRILTITGFFPDDPLGRDVRGRIRGPLRENLSRSAARPGWNEHDYATDMKTFQAIWMNKTPPWVPSGRWQ